MQRIAVGRHASAATIKSDVACFVRTYVSQPPAGQASHEDTLESPLTEIGLIRPVGRRDGYRFVRGHKPTLGAGVFCYAVTHFWSEFSAAQTLSFESLAYEPGSPGRVFLLDENALADRLFEIEEVSGGRYRWSETAGLKQLIRKRKVSNEESARIHRSGLPILMQKRTPRHGTRRSDSRGPPLSARHTN